MKQKKQLHTGDGWTAIAIIIILIVIDQAIKILVKTNMELGQSLHITDWFQILFIENNGMAYGMTFFNKLVLSLFRLVAIAAISFYLWRVVHTPHRRGYVISLAMVLAGAAGNMFDSMLYGLIFTPSTYFSVAHFVPFGTGYAPFLYGKVVDMFYFPLVVSHYPDWFPVKGGEEFIFFSPVFNFADACISVSVVVIFLWYRNELEHMGDIIKGVRLQEKTIEPEGQADIHEKEMHNDSCTEESDSNNNHIETSEQ